MDRSNYKSGTIKLHGSLFTLCLNMGHVVRVDYLILLATDWRIVYTLPSFSNDILVYISCSMHV